MSLPAVRKAFVETPHGLAHLRVCGEGPPVVLLHDSPRSSAMHVALLSHLGQQFTALALDTPGYGHSAPLPATPRPEIADFARALAATLGSLGIERCPVYGFHTSSKITLQFAIDHPGRLTRGIIDGLNLPPGGPSEEFIARYMKPYRVESDGSHLAAAWSKAREFHRFFPWFDASPRTRLDLDFPDERALHAYSLDMLSAGEHYSAAYSAAMRYLALPQLPRLEVPMTFMCRADDPLYVYLDALPQPLPPHSRIERLPADRAVWRDRVTAELREGAQSAAAAETLLRNPLEAAHGGETRGYVDLPHGQMHVRRVGAGAHRPLLLLPELPGASISAMPLARALAAAGERAVYVLDLPGIGESDALPLPELAALAQACVDAADGLGLSQYDICAQFTAGPCALEIARRARAHVHAIVLDGVLLPTAAQRRELWKQYCPPLAARADGAHYLALWHRMRDQELCWPWYERGRAGIRRRAADLDAQRLTSVVRELARQLDHYGDAARAAFDEDPRTRYAAVDLPVLVLHDPADARDAVAPKVQRLLQHGELAVRASDAAADAATMLRFLSRAAA